MDYLQPLKELFEANSNPENAYHMKKYLKDQFEHYGIKTPLRKELSKKFINEHGLPTIDELPKVIKKLWELPQRDYQYFAIRLLDQMVDELEEKHLELLEYLIVTKSWWDSVDGLSSLIIGRLFQKHMSAYMGKYVEQSPGSENWWVYWSHIRSFFYVYSYASGLLISKSLQNSVKKDPRFINKVKDFLSAGLSDSPKNIFQKLGVDISDKNFWNKGLDEVESLLEETISLAKKLGKI